MSAQTSPSPPSKPAGLEETRFPRGHCRYLLSDQGLKGQRCGCAHFTHNKNIPSAVCVCGHQSCFHSNEPYIPELEYLKESFKALKLEVERQDKDHVNDREKARQEFLPRLSNLEELVDKSREDVRSEIQSAYANISQSWNSIRELEHKNRAYELQLQRQEMQLGKMAAMDRQRVKQIEALQAELRSLDNRIRELHDADIGLEERVEALEELDLPTTPASRSRRQSAVDRAPVRHAGRDVPTAATSSSSSSSSPSPSSSVPAPLITRPVMRPRNALALATERATTWTTHISLLPDRTTPFPFEKDTNAYMRCLSRGLHQSVVINGLDAQAFHTAVTNSFGSLLRGRTWMPLQARLCNAETLQGLPMLRQLPEPYLHGQYDNKFLREHCGVCDPNGRIDSLYIAMRYDTFSWHALRHAPVFKDLLEAHWEYDPKLDRECELDDSEECDRPSAGDLLPPTVSSNLKRTAAEISRSDSFGAKADATTVTTEGEGQSRPKSQRVAPNMIEA